MFSFKAEDDEHSARSSRLPRIAALSAAFLTMVALTLAAMVAIGFVLFWVVRAIQD